MIVKVKRFRWPLGYIEPHRYLLPLQILVRFLFSSLLKGDFLNSQKIAPLIPSILAYVGGVAIFSSGGGMGVQTMYLEHGFFGKIVDA